MKPPTLNGFGLKFLTLGAAVFVAQPTEINDYVLRKRLGVQKNGKRLCCTHGDSQAHHTDR